MFHPSPQTAVSEALTRMSPDVDTGVTPEIMQILLDHGRRFIPAPPPDDLEMLPPGHCFDASWINAYNSGGKYRYVEGVALDPDRQRYWALHGWVTDGEYAYDPTWSARDDAGKYHAVPTIYLGIEMETMAVARFIRGNGDYVSVFANRWRHPELADKAIYGK